MVVELKCPENDPKLTLRFEKETGKKVMFKNGMITKGFSNWLLENGKPRHLTEKHKKNIGKSMRLVWTDDYRRKILEANRKRKELNNIENPIETKIKIDYNHIYEFFLNFLNEHAYFSKRLIIGIYKDELQPYADEYNIIEREFTKLISCDLKSGILEKYTRDTYKINKELVES